MSNENFEKQLKELNPAQPGPHIRQRVVDAAQAAAAQRKAGSASPARAARVLPMRRWGSIAAILLCAAGVGLFAFYSQLPGDGLPPAGLRTVGAKPEVVAVKQQPTVIDILNEVPQVTHPINPKFEVPPKAAFCRVAMAKGLITSRDAKAAAFRWKAVGDGDTFAENTTIRVAGDGISYAVLALQDGTEILLGTGSELTVAALRDLKLNGGRAVVRAAAGAPLTLTASSGETFTASNAEWTKSGKAGSAGPSATFQISDHAFALAQVGAYIHRGDKVRGGRMPIGIRDGGDEMNEIEVPRVSNLAVLQGSVQLQGKSAARTVPAGSRVNLASADLAVEHDSSLLGPDCAWAAACEIPADRGVGKLEVTSPDVEGTTTQPIEVGRININVQVRDQIALTVIDEFFVNKNNRQLEGKFYFPLPADASISSFAMWIDDRKVTGEIVERERAREIYEQILREKRDPGLLEWAGGNLFQARVFPIPANGEKHIQISYTQVLPYHDGRVHYDYPLMSEMVRKNPLKSLQIALSIGEDPQTTDLHSGSHNATAAKQGIVFSATNYAPAQDFTASWIPNGQMPELKLMPHVRADEGGFYMAMVTPRTDSSGAPLPVLVDNSPEARRWLFVVDASGSVDRETWSLTRAALESLFTTAGGEDTFNVIVYDVEARTLFDGFVPATGVNFDKVSRELSKVDPFGASNIEKAFDLAGQNLAQPGTQPVTLVYVGDGIASAGEQRTPKLLEHIRTQLAAVKGLNGYAVAVGGSFESDFIDGLARNLRGLGLRLDGLSDLSAMVGQVTDTSNGSMLTDVTVNLTGVKSSQQYPQVLPNLRLGDQLILTGRYSGSGQAVVEVSGLLNGRPWTKTYTTQFPEGETAGTNSFVPRLWAKRHITFLLNQIDLEEGSIPEMKNAVIEASKKYTLITPFTSFLVLESEEDYARFKVARNFNMNDWQGDSKPEAPAADDLANAGTGEKMDKASEEAAGKDGKNAEAARRAPGAPPASNAPSKSEPEAKSVAAAPMEKDFSDMPTQASANALEGKENNARAEAGEELQEQSDAIDETRVASRDQQKQHEKRQKSASLKKATDSIFKGNALRNSKADTLADRERSLEAEDLESLEEDGDDRSARGDMKSLQAGESRKDGLRRYRGDLEDDKKLGVMGVGAGGGGGAYGTRSGGGRKKMSIHGGGSRAEDSYMPDTGRTQAAGDRFYYLYHADNSTSALRTVEQVYTSSTDNVSAGLPWAVAGADTAKEDAIGEYAIVATKLSKAIDDKAQAILATVAGRLTELNVTIAPVDAATGKPAKATHRLHIRGDGILVERLDATHAKLTSDGAFTSLTRGGDLTPLRRKAQAGDRFLALNLVPFLTGHSVEEIALAFDVSYVSEKDGIVTLRMVERNTAGQYLLVKVETKRAVVVSVERYKDDVQQEAQEFSEFKEIATGVFAPASVKVTTTASGTTQTAAFQEYSAKAK